MILQIVDGVRNAIVDGVWREGAVLPTLREMAETLGVSMIVVRRAIRRLANDGYVRPRPKTGIVVLKPPKIECWKGRVLFVLPEGDDNFFINMMGGVLRSKLSDAGWLYSTVAVPRKGRTWDFRSLGQELGRGVSLAVLVFDRPPIERYISNSSVPFVILSHATGRAIPGCRGRIRLFYDAPVPELVADCLRARIRTVLQIGIYDRAVNAVPALRAIGIDARELMPDWDVDRYGRIEGAQRAGLEAMEGLLASGTDALPDLLILTDDFLATGALLSLSIHGVRVPEDVRVVAMSNRYLGPVYPIPLSRLELDAFKSGEHVARWILGALDGKPIPARARIELAYIRGCTFPVPLD